MKDVANRNTPKQHKKQFIQIERLTTYTKRLRRNHCRIPQPATHRCGRNHNSQHEASLSPDQHNFLEGGHVLSARPVPVFEQQWPLQRQNTSQFITIYICRKNPLTSTTVLQYVIYIVILFFCVIFKNI